MRTASRIPGFSTLALSVAVAIFGGTLRAQSAAPVVGGLVSYLPAQPGPNLLVNPGFEDQAARKPVLWNDIGFTWDDTVSHNGKASFRVTDANRIPYAQSASQTLQLKRGTYRIAGWVKLSGMAASTGSGVRLCLYAPPAFPYAIGTGCTSALKGTADWQFLELTAISVAQDTPAKFAIEAYGDPDGTAWFDDLELRREERPLEAFPLYPNFRGLLFDDQSQTAQFHISIDPPGEAAPSDFILTGEVDDEITGRVLLQQTFPAAASLTARFDLSSFAHNRAYLVKLSIGRADGTQPYTYPAYRIVKVPASLRGALTVSFDERNRFLLRGKPAFLLGVYDSGMGYASTEAAWESQFNTSRRLFELPINLYLNYWYGGAPNSSMLPMMDALLRHGIYNLTNANCFSGAAVGPDGAPWYFSGADAVIQERASHPGFAGFYAADECVGSLVPDVFRHYQRMRALDPAGMVFGTLLPNHDLPLWRDALDVMATDPYPMYGAEPVGGYPLYQVADSARNTRDALFDSRPFVTVIQFFKFTSKGRWPTRDELRSMSYAAIAGGANGILYWSLGVNALAYVCDGSDSAHSPSGAASWCPARVDNFTNLKSVIAELKALEPILTLPDGARDLIVSDNSAIRMRVKQDGDTVYLIAYNASNDPQRMSLRSTIPLKGAALFRPDTPLDFRSTGLSDSLEGNGVQVYRLDIPGSNRKAPPPPPNPRR